MNRFLKFTTQEEPAISGALIGAIILAIISRYIPLSDEDLTLLGPIALIIGGVILRFMVFSPETVKKLTGRDLKPPEGTPMETPRQ